MKGITYSAEPKGQECRLADRLETEDEGGEVEAGKNTETIGSCMISYSERLPN